MMPPRRRPCVRAARGLRLLGGLLAILSLAGCWVRVPSRFDPAPPRLPFDALEVNDLSARERLVVLVFGDSGTGSDAQAEVGRRMAGACAARRCDLALMLGDNFYERGVHPERAGTWDPAFIRKFEAPYEQLVGLQFWAVAGNHDWQGGRDSVDTQVAYSLRSERWRMPAYDYAVPGLPPWVTIYALDTVVLLQGVDIGQRERARGALCDAPGWRILVGHDPVYSSGPHGGPGGGSAAAQAALMPLLRDCEVDLYLSGHEHHQEHLVEGGLHQIIQGAAARVRSLALRRASSTVERRFAASHHGFALLEISDVAIEVEFFGSPPGVPQAFGSIYRTTISNRRRP